MEKDFYPWTQNPVTFPIDMAGLDSSNCSLDMNFYNTGSNWDQNDPFESALSSMVSSPAASAAPAAVCGGGVQLIELIGKLGSVRSPSEIEIPNHSYIANQSGNNNNSCYSTPMNSPPKLNMDQIRPQLPALSPFTSNPGFAERAARFSCFGSRSFNGRMSQSQRPVNGAEMAYNTAAAGPVESNRLQRVSSCQLPKSHPSDSKEESSVSQKVDSNEGIGRKRKSTPRGKAKEAQSSKVGVERNDSDSKRTKSGENESKEDSKPPEPFKDYIHVRARRGQATDSHSLAERVRREKISERMKFLQDLVPGCNKVTGKAVMLDEIINYVQSLQQQVEFLSMKLATVNPRMDSVHVEALLSKELLQSRVNMYPVESSNSASAMFPFAYQSQDSQLCNNSLNNDHHHLRQSMNGVCNSASQVSMWEDELHNVVQMGFATEQSEMKMEP